MQTFFSKLLSTVLWATFFGLVGYQALHYYNAIPCKNPIEYKIGTVDPRFKVSVNDFKNDLNVAGSLWSQAVNTPLFEYNPKGDVTVNLIYDDRQKITDQETKLNSSIDSTTQVAQSVKDQFSQLKTHYAASQSDYQTELNNYNNATNEYNTQVAYWNTVGGAPSDEYQKLQTQKADLTTERNTLESKRQAVNDLANQLNALIDKYNLLVAHINENVDAINNDGLSGTQFEEGVYITDQSGKRINIYQFDNQTTFLRVLAHEMGHSLGLDHNNGKESIMNPVNQGDSLVLSAEDIAALKALCKS